MHLGVDKRGKNVYHLCVDFLGFYRCVMKICKNCGEINLNDSEYCCNCGKNSFVFSEEVTCPVCGAANDKSYTHCTNCGSALSNHDVLPAIGNVTPEEVSSVRAELQTVYEQSLNVHAKEQLVCPNCGSSVNINSIYCDKCGTPVYRLNDHRVVKRKICPHCGRPNLPTSPYCSYCFASLADSVSEDFQLIHESKQVGNAVVQQAYLQSQEGKSKICNNCGTLNKPDEDFCVNCGLKLVMEPIKLYCPNCGMENQPDSLFCTRCQWSFEGQSPDSVGDLWTCGQCNRLNDKDSQFCFHCGAKREQNGGTK